MKDGIRLLLFHMTVSIEHTVSGDGLQQLLAMLPRHLTVELYFVLPRDAYDKFGEQEYVSAKSQPLETVPDALRNVTQFALLMDMTPASSMQATSNMFTVMCF
jgi:hypothetical protein